MKTTRYILMDIEGTTTPITFVQQVLFPYSRAHLPAFVRDHGAEPVVQRCLAATQATAREEQGRDLSEAEAVAQLLAWIDADRKHPALKTLQGCIWRAGYETQAFTSELYPDVPPTLATWKARGLGLGIYSSGSVAAQKLLFAHTAAGDLTPLFSDYFDTEVGGKRERAAYETIVGRLRLPAGVVAFLSDVEAELDAAREAGLKTIQLVRPGTEAGLRHPTALDFPAVAALLG